MVSIHFLNSASNPKWFRRIFLMWICMCLLMEFLDQERLKKISFVYLTAKFMYPLQHCVWFFIKHLTVIDRSLSTHSTSTCPCKLCVWNP